MARQRRDDEGLCVAICILTIMQDAPPLWILAASAPWRLRAIAASVRHRGVCAPSRRPFSVAASVLRRGVRSPSRRLCSVAASCPSISTNRFERARHARHQERRRPLRREPRCSRSGRVGGRVLVAQCRVSQPLKDTDDGFVDLSSRTRADTLSFSVVLVHETSEIKKTRAGAAFGSDHYRSAFESATGALPGTCNFGTTDVYTKIGPT
jgi:hypothetical protein